MLAVTIVTAALALPTSTPHSVAENKAETHELVVAQNYFAHINLQAKAAYVYDLTSGKVLFAKNESVPLPLASLTKIMTTVTAADLAPLSTEVTIDAKSLMEDGDSGLYVNERWSLDKLLQYTLVASSNDGATAVASSLGILINPNTVDSEATFIGAMNAKAQALGLQNMRFSNASGLDLNPSEAGAYGSAHDVGHLLAYAIGHEPTLFEPTRYPSYAVVSNSNFTHTAENTDILTNKISGLVAGKTGYTDLAGGNLAVVFDAGIRHPIAVVVLGSTYDGRFEDVQTLVDTAVHSITNQ